MGQEELNQRTKSFSELVDAFVEELAKVDRAGRKGVEMELSYWIKAIFPLLKTVHDIVNDDLNKYWQTLCFLSTIDVFIKPVQQYKTVDIYYVLSLLPPQKADFILGKIENLTSVQFQDLRSHLSKKDKYGFIQVLRQTQFKSISRMCKVLGSFVDLKYGLEWGKNERRDFLFKAYGKKLIPSNELKITDEFYNCIIDCYTFFNSRYASYKRSCDGSLANVLLAIALSLHYKTFDYFLVLMHIIGTKIYYCLACLFLEIRNKLSQNDLDAIYSILYDADTKEYDRILNEYMECDTPMELEEFKRRYCDLLNVKHHTQTYSYFDEEELAGHHKRYKMPQLQDSLRYELGYTGIQWDLIMNSYIDSDSSIPRKDLVYSPEKEEDLTVDENTSIMPPCNQDDEEPASIEPQPEQLSAADYNQETITVDSNLTDRDYETFAYPLLQGKKKGRHRGKWYDTKCYVAAEDELGDSIKRDVWPLIREHLGEFDYPDSVAGESKRTIVKNLGAALIYYAAQGTIPPIAKDWNAQGVKSSYERTFKRIEKVARNSVDAFMTMLKQYEEVEPLLESDQKNKAMSKLLVLLKNYKAEQKKYILSHNLYEIKGLIEYLRDRLPVIFEPYCKDK